MASALLMRAYRYTKIMVPTMRNTDRALPRGQLREDMNWFLIRLPISSVLLPPSTSATK